MQYSRVFLLLTMCLLAVGAVAAQTRGVPESGLITWPVFSSGPIRAVPEAEERTPQLLTELSTKNVYIYDPGYSVYYRLIIADYEVSNARASYGWQPAGRLGDGEGRLEVNATGRVLWGGFLDPIIQFHHDVTTLPSAGQENRPQGDSLVVFAPVIIPPRGRQLSEYPDDQFVTHAVLGTAGPAGSVALGASYSRSVLAPWMRLFLSAGLSTLPRVHSTIGGGGGVSGDVTGGVHVQWHPLHWLRLSAQGDLSGMAVVGAGVWRSVLTNNALWHGAGRVDLILGEVTVATVFSIRRAPIAVPYYRIWNPSVSLDIAAYVPVPGRRDLQLVLGFIQDFPPSYVAPDFGISLGVMTPIGRN